MIVYGCGELTANDSERYDCYINAKKLNNRYSIEHKQTAECM